MKKSLLALFVATTFLLSSCNENENQALSEKLQQAEQTIAQLKQELAKSKQNSTAFQTENGKTSAENFPALQVEIEPLFSQSKTVSNEYREDMVVSDFVSTAKTGITWLDNLLLRQLWLNIGLEGSENPADPNAVTNKEKAELIEKLSQSFQSVLSESDELMGSMRSSLEMHYLGQRNNLATFSIFSFVDTGGAHGNYATHYINIDTNKKSVITLDTLMSKANQNTAKKLLWEEYERQINANGGITGVLISSKEEFYLSENFYFNNDGIVFSYPPYALGSFAEGEKTLTLYWYDANKLITAEYQRTKKDGFGLGERW